MFKKAKHTSEARPRMYGLLLVTISLVVGAIRGSTSYNYFGAGTEKPFHQLLHEAMAVMDKGMKAAPMTDNPDRDLAAMISLLQEYERLIGDIGERKGLKKGRLKVAALTQRASSRPYL
jgi:hypothetical protein